MVTTLATTLASPVNNGAAEVMQEPSIGVTAIDPMTCPRCDSYLKISYFEPECLQCGYVNYQYQQASSPKKTIINSGTRYVLRYVGEFPRLAKTLAHVKLHRLRNRAVYGVRCPFCGTGMTQTSLSGKRREIREERYKCDEGHRLSLAPGTNGSLGWK